MLSEPDKNPQIVLSRVSKKYRIFDSPTDRFLEVVWPYCKRHSDFLALHDIDLCIRKGETIGIVGRNGSGKSTLLQLLAGIMAPTSGSLTVNGRVSALLELGAGFNPEFSGRDNAVMNGVFRGLTALEMNEKMSEIEAFADIGPFFDRPVKTYSSGMFVRVAFAAAISIEPDILLVDEALAVGDVKFQYKCFNAFRQLQRLGVTIVLVTHDLQAVTKHCQRAVILENGRIINIGDAKSVTDRFYALMLTGEKNDINIDRQVIPSDSPGNDSGEASSANICTEDILNAFLDNTQSTDDRCSLKASYNPHEVQFGDRRCTIVDYLVICNSKTDPASIPSGAWVDTYVRVAFLSDVDCPYYGFSLKTKDGVTIFGTNLQLEKIVLQPFKAGDQTVYRFSIKFDLNVGDYFLTQGVAEVTREGHKFIHVREGLIHFSVDCERNFDGYAALQSNFTESSVFRKST